MLEKLFRSNAEVKTLGVVLFEESLHLREIARKAEISSYEAKRELDILVETGLLIPERKGNQIIFHQNKGCAFLQDVKNIYLKTEGPIAELKELVGRTKGIRFAFVFGSMARGDAKVSSDIDLMLVGDIDELALSEDIFKIQKKYGRAINYIAWTKKDLLEKVNKGSSFLKSIIRNKRTWLLGDEHEFVGIAEQGHHTKGRP